MRIQAFTAMFGAFIGATCAIGQVAATTTVVEGAPAATPNPPLTLPTPGPEKIVNLVICLDTSGSMSGLIDAARQNIWDVVNDLALAEPTPDLRVALLTYGNNGHDSEDGWVFIQTDFTTDLDLVSERLFGLTTNGGEELVGRVLDKSMKQLTWHPSDDALKLIVVAGNESADQDQTVSFRDACRYAIGHGVMVNAIYCGNPADDIAPGWKEVATLSDGHFAAIDQNNGTIIVSTPFDGELTELSAAINATFVPFTPAGQAGQASQTLQDSNAATLNSAAVASRAQTKGGALYRCSWDLVDACRQEPFKLEDVKTEDLPENMQAMTVDERRDYLDGLRNERERMQSEIADLGKKRQAYIVEQIEAQGLDSSKSFNQAMRSAIRAQASAKGFTFTS